MFSFKKISIGLFIFENCIIESYMFYKNRFEMFSLRRLVLSCLALRRLVLMFNFEKISIRLFSLRRIALSCVALRGLVLSCLDLRR